MIFTKIEDLEFENDILKNTTYNFEDLREVTMFNRFDIHSTNLEFILNVAFLFFFFLGFATLGIAWLYNIWRIKKFFENKAYITLQFQDPNRLANIIEEKNENDTYGFNIYKGKKEIVTEKYEALKTMVSQSPISSRVVFKSLDSVR